MEGLLEQLQAHDIVHERYALIQQYEDELAAWDDRLADQAGPSLAKAQKLRHALIQQYKDEQAVWDTRLSEGEQNYVGHLFRAVYSTDYLVPIPRRGHQPTRSGPTAPRVHLQGQHYKGTPTTTLESMIPQCRPNQARGQPEKRQRGITCSHKHARPPQQDRKGPHSATAPLGEQCKEGLTPDPSTRNPRAIMESRAMLASLEQQRRAKSSTSSKPRQRYSSNTPGLTPTPTRTSSTR